MIVLRPFYVAPLSNLDLIWSSWEALLAPMLLVSSSSLPQVHIGSSAVVF